jgi:hypothetical protein
VEMVKKTINGKFHDVRFAYGDGSYLPYTTDIIYAFDELNAYPDIDDCHCGGTIMTPENDF